MPRFSISKEDIFHFETGKDILRTGPGWIEILPYPIRHTQNAFLPNRAASVLGRVPSNLFAVLNTHLENIITMKTAGSPT
jgi:hypothetical protein